ncbi:hypothetical protein Hanom_Chr07g00650431 [Helianthus anomalus]
MLKSLVKRIQVHLKVIVMMMLVMVVMQVMVLLVHLVLVRRLLVQLVALQLVTTRRILNLKTIHMSPDMKFTLMNVVLKGLGGLGRRMILNTFTKAEHLTKKETIVRRKKKAKKNIGSLSVQQFVPQEPSQEAEMDPNLGFTAAEASEMVPSPPRSTEPTPIAPTRSIASTIHATTLQPTSERRQTIFSQMNQDEKVDFLFYQLQDATGQISRHTKVIQAMRGDSIKQQLEINTLHATVGRQAAEITCQ